MYFVRANSLVIVWIQQSPRKLTYRHPLESILKVTKRLSREREYSRRSCRASRADFSSASKLLPSRNQTDPLLRVMRRANMWLVHNSRTSQYSGSFALTQLHKISNLMEAYNTRVAKLSHIINANLIKKRDELVSRINGIEDRIEELKLRQEKIERDIRTECGYIVERLKNSEGSK